MIILYSIVLGRCCLITCLSRSVDYLFIMEIWKDIEGYEWKYQVSSLWRVKSLNYRRSGIEIVLNGSIIKCWHTIVWIYKEENLKTYSISKIVGIHFIPNPLNLPLVCHRDETLDERWALYNGVDNLFWWTNSDNIRDMYKKWRQRNHFQYNNPKPNLWKFWSNHPWSKKINQYDLKWNFIKEWGSIIEAWKELNIHKSSISSCCRWKVKTAWGFIWRYGDENTLIIAKSIKDLEKQLKM